MIKKEDLKGIITYLMIIILFILGFFVIKPIFSAIIYGILLGYIFLPVQNYLSKYINKTLTAIIILTGTLVAIVSSIILFFGSFLDQILNLYFMIQEINITSTFRTIFPDISDSEAIINLVSSADSAVSNFVASSVSEISHSILELPTIILQLFIVFLVFFFILRNGKELMKYILSLSPLKKETQDKFLQNFKDITNSVLIGQIIIGIIQGIISGIGYYLFGVPSPLIMTLITVIVGVIPMIGPWLVWIPLDIYLLMSGDTSGFIGLLIYGVVFINWIDTIVRPLIVSKKARVNSGMVMIGMIGGVFAFGVLGLIMGPLILAYILITLELYRKQNVENIFIKEEQ